MPTKTHSLNILLDPDTLDRLKELKSTRHATYAELIRNLISAAHLALCRNTPTCATGRPCFVPHMHPIQTALPIVPATVKCPCYLDSGAICNQQVTHLDTNRGFFVCPNHASTNSIKIDR